MDLESIRELYGYNRWANARSLEAAAAVSTEDFTREVGGSFASLRGTLAHMYGAEWIWLQRWKGISPRQLPFSLEFPDVASIRSRWQAVENERQVFLDALEPARLAEVLSYINLQGQTFAYPLRRMLQHVVNHGTYHRGQITTLLRQLGAAPLATDLLLYDDGKTKAS
jgi:uncharacterized damage-inducible protein DinB